MILKPRDWTHLWLRSEELLSKATHDSGIVTSNLRKGAIEMKFREFKQFQLDLQC